jgi:hypothetical protein
MRNALENTMRAPKLAGLDTRSRAQRDTGVSATSAIYSAREVRASDQYCAGCVYPVSDVGFLTPCRVTFREPRKASATVDYCQGCLGVLDASVIGGLHTAIVRVERLTSVRPAFPCAVAPIEYFGFYRRPCGRAMRAWVQATIADLLQSPADEHDARCVAEEFATREILRPLHAHETRLIADAVRDLLTARQALAPISPPDGRAAPTPPNAVDCGEIAPIRIET